MNLNLEIWNLPYIGPRFWHRFQQKSRWTPVGVRNAVAPQNHPLRTLRQLVRFVNTRRPAHATRNAQPNGAIRNQLSQWLSRILKNARPGQCVGNPIPRVRSRYRYKVRPVNFMAWNSVIQFLRDHCAPHAQAYLPGLKRHQQNLARAYPRECRA